MYTFCIYIRFISVPGSRNQVLKLICGQEVRSILINPRYFRNVRPASLRVNKDLEAAAYLDLPRENGSGGCPEPYPCRVYNPGRVCCCADDPGEHPMARTVGYRIDPGGGPG